MSATRSLPISFPAEKTINKHIVEKLLCKRSYIDPGSNELKLLQGGNTPPSVAHVPEKYSKILHIISYRYEFYSQALMPRVLDVTPSSDGMQIRRL